MILWYSEIEPNKPVSQGDIFFNCPIPVVNPGSIDINDPYNSKDANIDIYTANIVVVTQACDLSTEDNNEIVDNVVVVPLDDVETMQTDGNKWDYISQVLHGRRPNAYLLNEHKGSIKMGCKIADFSTIFTIPYNLLKAFCEKQDLRLRLNSPHRELLS